MGPEGPSKYGNKTHEGREWKTHQNEKALVTDNEKKFPTGNSMTLFQREKGNSYLPVFTRP